MALLHARYLRLGLLVLAAGCLLVLAAIWASGASGDPKRTGQVTVPLSDRFTPFALTIRQGESVRWVNTDEDDHTVVSDDAFNTTDNRGTDELIAADGGSVTLKFKHPGTFVYYCRFHAHLDEFGQPVAPGPDGGIQDTSGNFGTPMMGVVTVQRGNDH